VFAQADAALYEAKRSGRYSVCGAVLADALRRWRLSPRELAACHAATVPGRSPVLMTRNSMPRNSMPRLYSVGPEHNRISRLLRAIFSP
jgi:hypothetical protein